MRARRLLLACLCLTPLHAAQDPPPAPSGQGRISGRVLAASGLPIEGATVVALLFTGTPQARHAYTATSADDGTFDIGGLPAGRFRVVARKDGFSAMTTEAGRIGEGVSIDLAAHGSVSGIDLVLRPTSTIAGRVRRPDGTPVARATVWVHVQQPDGRPLGVQPPATTGPDGSYRLENVPQGRYLIAADYTVRFEMIGRALPARYEDWARTFHPSAARVDEATPVTVRGGEVLAAVDVTLVPESRFSVTGFVVDAEGRTLERAHIQYGAERESGAEMPTASGAFTISGVRSGPVHLLARADGPDGPLLGFVTVVVQEDVVPGARVVVGPPARVRGRLTRSAGPVPPDLQVRFATPWPRVASTGDAAETAPVAADGSFVAPPLIGPRLVSVAGLPADLDLVEVRRGDLVLPDRRLDLTHAQAVDDLVLVLGSRN